MPRADDQGSDFVVKLREADRIVREVLRQELEGDGLTELQVLGAVDLTHSAAAEGSDDAKTPGEKGAGREAPPVSAARRRDRIVGEARDLVHRSALVCFRVVDRELLQRRARESERRRFG